MRVTAPTRKSVSNVAAPHQPKPLWSERMPPPPLAGRASNRVPAASGVGSAGLSDVHAGRGGRPYADQTRPQ